MGRAVVGSERALWIGASLLVSTLACFVDPGPVGLGSDGSTMTTTEATSEATSVTSDGTTTTLTGGSSTTGPECDEGGGCGIDEVCVDGVCELLVCEPQTITRGYSEPLVMLLVDKSRSMVTNTWDHDGIPDTPPETRWKTLHATLSAVAAGEEANVDFGLKLFPDIGVPAGYESAACGVSAAPDIPLAPGASASLPSVLPDAEATSMMSTIAGGTPASVAILGAVQQLVDFDQTDRALFILMLTDGAANCRSDAADDNERFESYDESVIVSAQEAVAAGVEVGVLGLDVSGEANPVAVDGKPDSVVPLEVVTALALSGGLPMMDGAAFTNAVDQSTLEVGLRGLLKVMRCTIVATPPPGGALLSSVSVGGAAAPSLPGEDCGLEVGWLSLGGDRLRLCGETCSSYLTGESLGLDYVCE